MIQILVAVAFTVAGLAAGCAGSSETSRFEAPGSPDRPADPIPDALVKHNVDVINGYRKAAGVPPLLYDARISAYSTEGSRQLAHDHAPHAHFKDTDGRGPGMGSATAENQGDPAGVPRLDPDPKRNGKAQIDMLLKLMFSEGPGGGHHDNMLSTKYKRLGVGIYSSGGRLYLTNDFSN